MSDSWPALAELLPQRGAMRLLDRVLAHDDAGTRCAFEPAAAALFLDESGRLPAWLALELMAQCAAADGALRARGLRDRRGLLLGARRISFSQPWLDADRPLEVTARRASGRGRRFAFECAVGNSGASALARGRVNVLLTDLPGEMP